MKSHFNILLLKRKPALTTSSHSYGLFVFSQCKALPQQVDLISILFTSVFPWDEASPASVCRDMKPRAAFAVYSKCIHIERDTALPWVLSNKPAKCEIWMNGSWDMQMTSRHTEISCFLARWSIKSWNKWVCVIFAGYLCEFVVGQFSVNRWIEIAIEYVYQKDYQHIVGALSFI